MSDLALGLELMLVGMTSVFIILIIVILLGKLMIKVTNRIPVEQQSSDRHVVKTDAISNETKSIIEAAVAEITGGKGSVSEIVKL